MLHRGFYAKRLHPAGGSCVELSFELPHECPWTHRCGFRKLFYVQFSIQMRFDPDRKVAHSRVFYILLLRQQSTVLRLASWTPQKEHHRTGNRNCRSVPKVFLDKRKRQIDT